MSARTRLVLASGSTARRALLQGAGVAFEVRPADVDEAALRDGLLAADAGVSHESVALALAEAKALAVSAEVPDALVIGADQVLSFEGRLFEKPKSIAEARAQLLSLRGKTHALHSATVLAEAGEITWRNVETAVLTLRDFGESALDAYLARAGETVLTSVGAYRIEGPAVQLFAEIDGDHATILGLPLLPLLKELRRRAMLVA
ncbi:MAG: Maf family protein [Hyphomicrobium sp.]|uniref:Maf family protein n=1 Tax=Hyphomicrobium sp. TaxID=82 RepID=UPI003D0C29D7